MNIDVLAKGFYSHPQIRDFVSVNQYMFVSVMDKKYLTVRLTNDAGFTIDAISLDLYQLDSEGNTLKVTRVTQEEPRVLTGNTFTLKELPELDDRCADIRVKIIYVISGAYRYTVHRDRVTVRYIPPKKPRAAGRVLYRRHGAIKPKRRLFMLTIVAIIAAMIIVNMGQIVLPLFAELGGFDFAADLMGFDYVEESDTSSANGAQRVPINDIFTVDTMFVEEKLSGENNAEIR